jgi:hypothetical protein
MRQIIESAETQAAGEADERLLLTDLAEHFRRSLQCRKLTVVVKDVELAVILPKGSACIRTACSIDRFQ